MEQQENTQTEQQGQKHTHVGIVKQTTETKITKSKDMNVQKTNKLIFIDGWLKLTQTFRESVLLTSRAVSVMPGSIW